MEKLKHNQGFLINEEKWREKIILKEGRVEDSFFGGSNEDIDFNFEMKRKEASMLCE